MERVVRLRPVERVLIDQRQIARLRLRLGASGGDAALGAALEELAYWLYHFDAAIRRGDEAELLAKARRIADLAETTGLSTVRVVANALVALCEEEEVARAAADPDPRGTPARRALAARLTRVGEASILSAWDLQDASI